MNNTLPEAARQIQRLLQEKGLDHNTVIEFSTSTRTAQDAATAIGCQVAQIAKSLLFKTDRTNVPVFILVSGPNRVNEIVIESFVGQKIVKADADFVRAVTGFAIGGVAPIGHQQKIEYIFIDQDLLAFDTIWAAAGTANTVFSMPSNQLSKLIGGRIINIHTKI